MVSKKLLESNIETPVALMGQFMVYFFHTLSLTHTGHCCRAHGKCTVHCALNPKPETLKPKLNPQPRHVCQPRGQLDGASCACVCERAQERESERRLHLIDALLRERTRARESEGERERERENLV